MGGPDKGVPALPPALLSPELLERLHRMAAADGLTLAQVLEDAVQIAWVRWGCRRKLKPEEW